MDQYAFRKMVANARSALGLSQAELARRAGLDPSYVNKVESGKKPVTLRFIDAIMPVLGISHAGVGGVGMAPAVPAEGVIDEKGRASGRYIEFCAAEVCGLDPEPIGSLEVPVLLVDGSDEDWCAIRASSDIDLQVSSFRMQVQAGDMLIVRPVKPSETLAPGSLVIVSANGPDGLRIEARVLHPDGGRSLLWPVAKAQRVDELAEPWRLVSVAVELRRSFR